eukprot:scaffold78373_cov53-Phaeocystis_antarctica.AAC.3
MSGLLKRESSFGLRPPWCAPSASFTPLGLPSNVTGTPRLGMYQPSALCAVARCPTPQRTEG